MNWPRFLVFLSACMALGWLDGYLPENMGAHTNWAVPVVPLVFIALFLVIYRLPMWKPRPAPMTTRKLVLFCVGLALILIADHYYERSGELTHRVPPLHVFIFLYIVACVLVFSRLILNRNKTEK